MSSWGNGIAVPLAGVDFTVQPGEVHALIGENGARKSTLMKVLSGVHRPDAGRIELDGEPYAPQSPLEARERGVAMIYQELALAPQLSVTANILLGMEPARRGWLDHSEARRMAAGALDTLGHPDIAPDAIAGSLSVGAQQLVEVDTRRQKKRQHHRGHEQDGDQRHRADQLDEADAQHPHDRHVGAAAERQQHADRQ